jgi:hypothetical protein
MMADLRNPILHNDLQLYFQTNQDNKHIEKLVSKLKFLVFKAAAETTGHGIPKIFNNILILQALWFVAFSASTAACAYMIRARVA